MGFLVPDTLLFGHLDLLGNLDPQNTHRPLSSSFLGLPYRILHTNHKKELLRGLGVNPFQA